MRLSKCVRSGSFSLSLLWSHLCHHGGPAFLTSSIPNYFSKPSPPNTIKYWYWILGLSFNIWTFVGTHQNHSNYFVSRKGCVSLRFNHVLKWKIPLHTISISLSWNQTDHQVILPFNATVTNNTRLKIKLPGQVPIWTGQQYKGMYTEQLQANQLWWYHIYKSWILFFLNINSTQRERIQNKNSMVCFKYV
jgi:hypothetical protein